MVKKSVSNVYMEFIDFCSFAGGLWRMLTKEIQLGVPYAQYEVNEIPLRRMLQCS